MPMNEGENSNDEKEENKNSSGKQDSGGQDQDGQKPESLTHKTAGVNITVSIKEEKDGQKDDEEKKDPDKKKQEEEKKKKPPLFKRRGFIIIAIIVAAVVIIAAVILWLILRQYVSTDDAYIDGNVSQISPRVAAQITALHVNDNELVHPGDLLVELDPTDFQVALDQARAQVISAQGKLKQAEAQIDTAKASVIQAQAQINAAQVQFENASKDLKRYQDVDERARSKQQVDNAQTAQKNSEAQLEEAKARKTSADADVSSAEATVNAARGDLQTAEANEHRAEVNLSYCKIYAPVEGRVTQRTIAVGAYVAPGQALFMLVDPNVWVTANFKETQLTYMKPGQPVTIHVDAFPGIKIRGHVDSIQAGSGSRFSILPAENATGNFVKIVQRVPVKIVFDTNGNTNNAPMLSPGLSVEPSVKVR
ncbi:MAG TPA: HlyD family secretion protein [Verrucomicrobiae bacterium]|jgi:membrane fusion protein (multidrug efflux system)